jgi:autotransporter-associated beta strand protein
MSKTLVALLLLLATLRVDAATHIWTGAASSLFSDPANWRGGSPAGDAAADLSFPAGAARLTATNDLPSLTIRSLSISASGYTIGGLPLTLASGGEVIDSSSGPTTVACDVHLSDRATFRAEGDLDDAGGMTMSGAISGAGPLTKTGEGRLTFIGTKPNTYSGGTVVLDGELRLGKSSFVHAVAGNVTLSGIGFGHHASHLVTIANEQIPDSATIQVGPESTMSIGGFETIGPLEVGGGAKIRSGLEFNSSFQSIGTIILRGDIRIFGRYPSIHITTFEGDFALAGTRTMTICEVCPATRLSGFRDYTPGSGLTLRGGTVEILNSTYYGPTMIEGSVAFVDNPNTAVRLRGGSFEGNVASLLAESGTILAGASQRGVTTSGDLRLSRATSVRLGFDAPAVKLSAGGTFDLGQAPLIFEHGPDTMVPGDVYVIGMNGGPEPIRGTFGGVPEGTVLQQRLRVSYTGGSGNDLTLTEVGRYPTILELDADPDEIPHGAPLTLTAYLRIERTRHPVAPYGIVTFREGDTLLGMVALDAAGVASVTFPATSGVHTYTASYAGSAELAPSASHPKIVDVIPPASTITSIEPSTVQGGTTATLTIRGTGFLPGGSLRAEGFDIEFTWISATELQATWGVWRSETDRQAELWYVQPGPSQVESNRVPLLVKAAPEPKTSLVFEQKAITGPVIPGGGAAWMSVALRRVNFNTYMERRSTVMPDTDRDGLVRWEHTDDIAPHGIYLMTDMTDGSTLAGRTDGLTPPASPFPHAMFLRDSQGRYSHLIFDEQYGGWDLLWVRPGAGAWTMNSLEGGPRDLDGSMNGYGVYHVSQMTAVAGSPQTPAGVEPGDVLLGISWDALYWFGDRVDTHLGESNGPGSVRFVDSFGYALEGSPLVVKVLRVGGTDGTVSVNYKTVNGTALGNVHYAPAAGTVTFGPGEILKSFEIAPIDDQRFLGDTDFRIVLSEPAGTTITESSVVTVELQDNDPRPQVSAQDITVTEGDRGTHDVQVVFTLNGTAHVPVNGTWEYEVDGREFKGALTFLPGGPTSHTVTVRYEANEIAEDDRIIYVRLENITNAVSSSAQSMITIVDDDIAEIMILDATVSESEDEALVTIATSTPSDRLITVRYTTVSGSATAGTDFTTRTATVWLGKEEIVRIPIVRDADSEGDEWFSVVLSEATGARITRDSATVTILDDESSAIPTISGSAPLAAETSYPSAAQFLFRLSFPTDYDVRFRAKTVSGTATAGADFVAENEILTIPAGQTEASLFVTMVDDALVEGTETFTVVLSEAAGATVATPVVSATILDLDTPFVDGLTTPISVTGTDAVEGNPARFTVRLARATDLAVTVQYATADGSAVSPSDYGAASGTLTFAPGETAKIVEIAIVDDALYELDETFTLVLGNAANARIATHAAVVHVIDNDPAPPPKGRAAKH